MEERRHNDDVIIERLDNLIERFDRHETQYTEDMKAMTREIAILNHFRISFTAKFTAYAAIALFCGSFIASIGTTYLLRIIK